LVVFLPTAVQAARTWIRREVTIEFQGRKMDLFQTKFAGIYVAA
jgi:hypothetical protein